VTVKTERYRIFLAEEHPVMRRGLTQLLTQQGWEVAGEADSGPDVVSGVCQTQPDLVVLGVQMPEKNGLEVLREIRGCCPRSAILIYTAFPLLENLLRAVDFGAAGFLLKTAPEEELVAQVRRIAAGEYILDTQWRKTILHEIQARSQVAHADPGENPLSHREVEILQAIAMGLNTQEIAKVCTLSVHTVGVHIQHILKKLRVPDRTQALVWAARRNLVTFE
jgi:DNA-binding NarL/FixJ family response regulator